MLITPSSLAVAGKWFALGVGAHVIALGYGAYFIGSPTAAGTRTGFLHHTKTVLNDLVLRGEGPETERLEPLNAAIKVLRAKADDGWAQDPEFSAFCRVFAFISIAHAKGTARAVSTLGNTLMQKTVDAVFTRHVNPADFDGNVRAA